MNRVCVILGLMCAVNIINVEAQAPVPPPTIDNSLQQEVNSARAAAQSLQDASQSSQQQQTPGQTPATQPQPQSEESKFIQEELGLPND